MSVSPTESGAPRQRGRLDRHSDTLLLVLVGALASACGGESRSLVLRGGTIIDGTGATPIEDAVLVVEEGRISCVGEATTCAEPSGADQVDADGFWIIPGLIDTHAQRRDQGPHLRSEDNARLAFLLGVTTMRAAGTPAQLVDDLEDAERRRDPWSPVPRLVAEPGATVVTIDQVLTAAGLTIDDGVEGLARSPWVETDPDSLSSIARAVAERGALIEPLLAAQRRYAQPYGVPIGLHRMLELPLVSQTLAENPIPEMSDETRLSMGEAIQRMEDFLLAFHEAGGVLVTGSEDGIAPGLAIHAEMSALVGAGLSPAAALAAATRDAAVAIGVQDSLGTLEPGKIADFVVLEGDPLADIANAQLVARVAKGGVLHDPATLFDDLADDMRSRTTPPWRRLLIGFGTMVIVLIATALAIRRHRIGLGSPGR